MANQATDSSNSIASQRDQWFEDMIAQLRIDQLQLETNTASREKREHYEALIVGDAESILLQQQLRVTHHFVSRLVRTFVEKALPYFSKISRLAATANDAEVLMWIELKEEDESLEDQLTMVEAEVNAAYHNQGYDLDMMIVEVADAIPTPEHYVEIYNANEPLPSPPAAGN